MKNLARDFLLTTLCGVLGACLALAGANIIGIPEDPWGLEHFVYLALGTLVGAIGFLVIAFLLLSKAGMSSVSRRGLAATGAVLLAFLSGLFVADDDELKRNETIADRSGLTDDCVQNLHWVLRMDPDVALREKWYGTADDRQRAYEMSIETQDVGYSSSTLGQLYDLDTNTKMVPLFLRHPAFDPTRLESEFHRRLNGATEREADCRGLLAILYNPQARHEWFAEVASSGVLVGDISPCNDSLRDLVIPRLKEAREPGSPVSSPRD